VTPAGIIVGYDKMVVAMYRPLPCRVRLHGRSNMLNKILFFLGFGGRRPWLLFFFILGRPPPMCVCVLSLSLSLSLSLVGVICQTKCFIACGYNIDTNRLYGEVKKGTVDICSLALFGHMIGYLPDLPSKGTAVCHIKFVVLSAI
jgi:hypothetical protein